MKKMVAIIMVVSMVTLLLSGCTNGDNGTEGKDGIANETTIANSGNDTEKDITTDEMPNIVFGYSWLEVPQDLEKVEAAINEITMEKIGATVNINAYTYGTVTQQTQMTLATPSEQLDVLLTLFYGVGINSFISKGQLTPLDELINNYGQGIISAVGEDVLDANRVDGTLYSITPTGEQAKQYGLLVRKDILEAVGYGDLEQVDGYADLTPVFEAIMANYPDLYTVGGGAAQSPYSFNLPYNIDILNDKFGVLENLDDPTVSNYFESDGYREICILGKKWNDAGYIYPDILTDTSNSGDALMSQDLLASYFGVYKPGAESEALTKTGYEVSVIKIGEPIATAGISWQYTIPTNAVYPEKAMEFINLLYSDEELINLLAFGVEGEHYELDANGQVVEGPNFAAYNDPKQWSVGNYYLTKTFSSQPVDLQEQMKVWNASANSSVARGFIFDSTEVSSEYTALQSVLSEYNAALQWGFVSDVQSKLDEFNEALDKAGLDKYMTAKQDALNAWLSSK